MMMNSTKKIYIQPAIGATQLEGAEFIAQSEIDKFSLNEEVGDFDPQRHPEVNPKHWGSIW